MQNFENTYFLSVLLGIGDGSFGPPVQTPLGQSPSELFAADFNGDGLADLALLSAYSSNQLQIFLASGAGLFEPPAAHPVVAGSRGMAAGDLRHSGYLDLVVGGGSTNTLAIFPGQANGAFGAASILGIGWPVGSVAIADFNSDGNLDLVTANYSYNASVLFGLGTGAFQAPKTYLVGIPSPSPPETSTETASRMPPFPTAAPTSGSPCCATARSPRPCATSLRWSAPRPSSRRSPRATALFVPVAPERHAALRRRNRLRRDDGDADDRSGRFFRRRLVRRPRHRFLRHDRVLGRHPLSIEFADVPTSSIFHADIITIATNGITAGCGGADSTPSALVNRAQMACVS